MALVLDGTNGVSLVQDGVVTAADLSSTLDLSSKTLTLPAGASGAGIVLQQVTTTTTSEQAFSSSSYVAYSGVTTALTATVANPVLLCVFQPVRIILESGASEFRLRFRDSSGYGASTAFRLRNEISAHKIYINPSITAVIPTSGVSAGTSLSIEVQGANMSGSFNDTLGDNGSNSRFTVMEMIG